MNRLELGDWFLVGIIVLQLGACICYLWKRRWLEATVYGAYMTAQIALITLSLRARV